MEHFAALMLLGVRVREVRNLKEGALFISDKSMLIVDEAMGDRRRAQTCEWALGEATRVWGISPVA